jgi:hypothetical protein
MYCQHKELQSLVNLISVLKAKELTPPSVWIKGKKGALKNVTVFCTQSSTTQATGDSQLSQRSQPRHP